jgi:hypothetical protein
MPLLDYVPHSIPKKSGSIQVSSPVEEMNEDSHQALTTRWLKDEECQLLAVPKGSMITMPASGAPFPLPRPTAATSGMPLITRGDRILLGLFPEEQNYVVPAGMQKTLVICPMHAQKTWNGPAKALHCVMSLCFLMVCNGSTSP